MPRAQTRIHTAFHVKDGSKLLYVNMTAEGVENGGYTPSADFSALEK